jgi:hypothetical protein
MLWFTRSLFRSTEIMPPTSFPLLYQNLDPQLFGFLSCILAAQVALPSPHTSVIVAGGLCLNLTMGELRHLYISTGLGVAQPNCQAPIAHPPPNTLVRFLQPDFHHVNFSFIFPP